MDICIFIFVVDLCGHCFDMSEHAAHVELVPDNSNKNMQGKTQRLLYIVKLSCMLISKSIDG